MPKLFERLLRAGESRVGKRLEGIAAAVNALEEDFEKMTDEELRGETDLFRERMVYAGWSGDLINHEVYPKNEGEWIPESQSIPLPTEALANAWSAQPEKGL